MKSLKNLNKNQLSQYLNNISEADLIKIIKQDIHMLQHVTNLSEKMKLYVVKRVGTSIRYIKDPSEELQLIAIKQSDYNIQFIKNPTENAQLESIKTAVHTIRFIKNPTEKVQIAAMRTFYKKSDTNFHNESFYKGADKDMAIFNYITSPKALEICKDEKLQLAAVRKLESPYIIESVVRQFITLPKALELYEKIKTTKKIII
jgi:hypothetical protein